MNLKKRLLGVVMLLPLAWIISVTVPTCKRGGRTGGPGLGSELLNNLATLGFFIAVPTAIAGLVFLFGSAKRAGCLQ